MCTRTHYVCITSLGLHDSFRPALVTHYCSHTVTLPHPCVLYVLLSLNHLCSEDELLSTSKYESMHEDNPLYAEVEKMLKEETVVSIEREVVIETVGQDSNVADFEFEVSKT